MGCADSSLLFQAQAQADSQAALTELQTRITTLEAEKSALAASLASQQTQQTTNDDSLKALQEKLTALEKEKATITVEKDRLAAREAPLFRDNVGQIRSLFYTL